MRISYLEAKSKKQGSRLGLLWIPLSTLMFTGMLALVFRQSETMSGIDFYLYVLCGYTLWIFVQDTVISSMNVIQKKLEFAVHNNLTLVGLFLKIFVDRLFEFGANLVLLLLATLILKPSAFSAQILLFIPFSLVVIPTSITVSYLVNIITIFSPDSVTIIKMTTRFAFFASPIFWVGADDQDGVRGFLAQYNPISYYLNIYRQVFDIAPLNTSSWIMCMLISVALCICGYVVFKRTNNIVKNIK